ncbi:MAG: BatD family protein [Spirochaetaceae bacterium]|nr:BatD family protein [Spirochaetaceae bacterium]
MKALVSIDQDHIQENAGFLLSILVNHEEPLEVHLSPPDFNGDFTMDRLRSEIHIINVSRESADKWTEIELLLTPKAAGKFMLSGFMISTPGQVIWTQPIEITVYPEEKDIPPKLIWDGVKNIQQGQSGEAYLRMVAGGAGKVSQDGQATIAAPRNALVDRLDINKDDKYAGIVFRVRITPLEGTEIKLETATLKYGNWKLAIPPLNIRILPENKTAAAQNYAKKDWDGRSVSVLNGGRQKRPEQGNPPPFPQSGTLEKSIFARARDTYFKNTVEQAQSFWEQERYADALALLRQGERDSIAGNDFAHLRAVCEKTLGIAVMANESRKTLVFFLFPAILALCFLAVKLLFFLHEKSVRQQSPAPSHSPWKSIVAALLLAGLCMFFLINRQFDAGNSAVMKSSPYFNVPETEEMAAGFLEEGTPVRVVTKSSNWIYVESETGSAGWVAADNLVLY